MRILHISTAQSWRGGEQQLAYLLGELKSKPLFQSVFCFRGSAIEAFCVENKIEYFSVSHSSAYNPILLYKLHVYCKKFNFQILHAHDSHAHTLAILAVVILGLKTNIVLSRKVDFPLRKNFFTMFKYNHPAVKKIICVSKKIESILTPDVKNKKILTCIYDGINLKKFSKVSNRKLRKEYDLAEQTIIIGNVAALADHKDYFTFVNTAEILLKTGLDAIFLIFGEGSQKEAIAQYIHEKALDKHIKLAGFRSEIASLLPEFDLFLFTSKTEGLGSSILDAYACEVPVVTTNAGGIPEIVKHNVTGLLASPGDAQALAAECLRVISDKELRNLLVKNASELVLGFSKEVMGNSTFLVYSELEKSLKES